MTDNNKGLTSVFRWYTLKFITCTATKQRWVYYTMKINWTTFQKSLCYRKDLMFMQACRQSTPSSRLISRNSVADCGLMTNYRTQNTTTQLLGPNRTEHRAQSAHCALLPLYVSAKTYKKIRQTRHQIIEYFRILEVGGIKICSIPDDGLPGGIQ